MSHLKTRILLGLDGLILFGVGASVLFSPVAFFAGNGITLPSHPGLLSEIRAPGAWLLATGLLLFVSAWRTVALRPALGLAALVYASYGVGRVLSLFLDGLPSSGLLGAAALELGLAVLNGAVWRHHRLGRDHEPAVVADRALGARSYS